MNLPANNVTTTDAGNEYAAPGARALHLIVSNAAVNITLGHGIAGHLYDRAIFFPPGGYELAVAFDTVKIASAVAGAPAQATLFAS